MRLSKTIFKTQKNPTDLDKGTDRLIRGCYIQKECSGIFRFNFLGFRSIEKIKAIIRKEMTKINCIEVALPMLQDSEIWKKSGRGSSYGPERFTLQDRKDATMYLAPTAEESATELLNGVVTSYKQLPITIYQMIEKYRDEMRPRYGLVRSRQFIMKDAYSFAKTQEEADELYVQQYNAYLSIFKEMGIEVYPVPSDVGDIGGKYTHEFVALTSTIGECPLYYNDLNNDHISSTKDFKKLQCSFEKSDFKYEERCLELGQIYYLGDSYSSAMKARFSDEKGQLQNFIMGCYGIGVTRVLSYLAESKKYLPSNVAPFKFHLVGLSEEAENFYQKNKNLDILFDDRDQSAGTKFSDADLIGIPYRIIIGNSIEFIDFEKNENFKFEDLDSLSSFIANK